MKFNKGDIVSYKGSEAKVLEISDDPAPYRVTYKIEMVTKTSTQRFWVHGVSLTKVNPHPKQIIQYDQFGNVTGAYTNLAYEEWEKLNGERK